MMLTPLTQAVLLLTAHFSKPAPGGAKPLTPAEWGRFAQWLKEQGLTPDALLTGEPLSILQEWRDDKVPAERICTLLSRSPALALAFEKWQRAGLWVVTRQDPDYPSRLKRLLKGNSPPFFFGCGNRQLMNRGGLAVVGSRNATEDDLRFARAVGARAAEQGSSVISGGARGIDETAMLGALKAEGTVLGVLADRLLKAATSATWRGSLMDGDLALISPFNPEAGFDVGNAMARNKYVYCLAEAALVVHSGTKGGTWSGALENLRQGWVPLWVKPGNGKDSGSALIVQKGGRWLSGSINELDIRGLFGRRAVDEPGQGGVFDSRHDMTVNTVGEVQPEFGSGGIEAGFTAERGTDTGTPAAGGEQPPPLPSEETETMSFYELFLRRVQPLTEKEAKTIDRLVDELEVCKSQLGIWIKRAVTDKHLRKLGKPVRYAWQSSVQRPKQATIF
jgi:predicted Rossmann fold nucleotide-binding protein DprA/Smf involved in DNA uptake